MPARLASSPGRRTTERRTITARTRHRARAAGSYAEALSVLDEVRTFCRSHRDHHGVASCDERIGHVLIAFQRPSEALERYSSAHAFYVRAELSVEASRAKIAVATALSDLGRHDDALEHLERARDAFGRNGDLSGLAASHLEFGVVLTRIDRDWEALDAFQEASLITDALGDELLEARCSQHCGVAWLHADELDNALDFLQDAREVYARHGMRREVAGCDIEIGNVWMELGCDALAADLYHQARAVFDELGLEIGGRT